MDKIAVVEIVDRFRKGLEARRIPHGYKYSLVYIEGRKRVIGYDNGERRGDHRHYGDKEEPYAFTSIDQLISDFRRDVSKWRAKR